MPPIATILDVEPFGARAAPGTGTAFLVLAAFVVSFLSIRTSARLTRSVSWWPGGVETGSGVHVHAIESRSPELVVHVLSCSRDGSPAAIA